MADPSNLPPGWHPMETAPKDRPILGWCLHAADPYYADETHTALTLYAGHGEGLSFAPDGPNVLQWGGAWEDAWEDGGGHMPDWWFVRGSEWEVVANPVMWAPVPDASGFPTSDD